VENDLPTLKSAYAKYDKHPKFTNLGYDFSSTLDYILHDLTTICIAEVLTHLEASREGCLPSSVQTTFL
jgi:hypothetical protein